MTLIPDADQKIRENKHEAINDFLRSKWNTGRSSYTLRQYANVCHRFFHSYFPRLQPAEVQIHHIEEFLRLIESDYEPCGHGNQTVTTKTKKNYINCLSGFYSWAMKRPRFEEITANPAAVVAEEIRVPDKPRPDCATWENAKRIIHRIDDPRDKTVATLLAKTGCRVSEACNIDIDDLMLQQGFIRLTDRKGGGETVAPIDPETVLQLRKYREMRRYPSHKPLFTTEQGNRLSTDRIRTITREAAISAGVMDEGDRNYRRKFTPHTFRTVFTTLMRNQGTPDHILKYIRGDSNEDMLDLYTRVDRDQARKHYLNSIKTLEI